MLKKLPTLFLTALLTLALSVWLLSHSILLPCGSDKLMLSLLRHYAPAAETGLTDSEYPAVAGMITDYLMGRTDAFQHTFVMNGAEYLAFNQKEQQHMADVQGLFGLCRRVLVYGGIAMSFLGLALARRGRDTWRGLRNGLLIVLGAVAAVALWAAIDFDSLFILFHRVAFTNDLWLLDPRTDLLIRLMPTEFFVAYAAIIRAVWVTTMGLFILLFTFVSKEKKA